MIYFFQSLSLKTRFLRVVLSFLFVLGFLWLVSGAPWGVAHLRMVGHGGGLPNFGFWSAPQSLQSLLEQWGDGRAAFLVLSPALAGLFGACGIFLAWATLYLLKKANPSPPWYLLPLLPLLGALFGILETGAVVVATLLPIQEADVPALAATVLTSARWMAFGLSLAVLVLGTAIALIRKGLEKLR